MSYAFVAATAALPNEDRANASTAATQTAAADKRDSGAEFVERLKALLLVAVPVHPVFDVAEYKKSFLSTASSTRLVVISLPATRAVDASAASAPCEQAIVACMQIILDLDPAADAGAKNDNGSPLLRQFTVASSSLTTQNRPAPGVYVLFPGNLLAWHSSDGDVRAAMPAATAVVSALRIVEQRSQGRDESARADAGQQTPVLPKQKKPGATRTDQAVELRHLKGEVRSVKARQPWVALSDSGGIGDARVANRPVVLVFWGTWCAPCRAEMPLLAELLARYPRTTVVGILIEETSVPPEKLTADVDNITSASRLRTNYVARDRALMAEIFADKEAAVPSFAVFDANGRLILQLQGAIADANRYERLEQALIKVSKGGYLE